MARPGAMPPVRRRIPSVLGLTLTATLTIACTDGASTPGDLPTVFDSAGVRVVDLGPAPLGLVERRSLAGEPDLVIRSSEDDPASVFADVRDVEVLPQGRVAVVNGSDNGILLFDSAGEHVDTWGGFGAGPGEFRYLEWLASLPPDSLAAGDRGLRRVTILEANGRYVRSIGGASAVDPASNPVPPLPMGLLADGSVVAAFFESVAPVAGTARPAVDIVAIPPVGDTVHPVGRWPGEELALFEEDGAMQVTQLPFGRRLHVAPAPDGVWIADDDRWEMRKYSPQGELRMVVRSSASPAAVSDELLEAWISERYRFAGQVRNLEDLKEDQRQIAGHTTTPSFGMVLGMSDGGLAVGEFGLDTASPRAWITVDPDGTVTEIELPAGLAVKRWGPDWVIGIVRDELDREEIHRYRILAGGGPGGLAPATAAAPRGRL